ncbi:hypothetical protein WJX72_010501 [[Myrmecia] bisecta]|uniref:BTB domain-containing protein n=1 Tax=[Myrmecia] bisecta TaxID=41462 RepID=A0AAW1RA46_9CHLO
MPICSGLLAGSSEYFRLKLENYQTPGEPLVMDVEDGEADLLRALVKFVYTEELDTTEEDSLLRLLLMAQKYTVDECVQTCSEALSQPDKLTLNTALEICQLADTQECHSEGFNRLCKLAGDIVLVSFKDLDSVWDDADKRDAFLELPLAGLKVLLNHADLHLKSENTVFIAVAWWLDHKEGRLDSFADLHSLLRWSQMSGSFLRLIFDEVPFLLDWDEADSVHIAALHYQVAHRVVKQRLRKGNPGLGPRKGAVKEVTSMQRFKEADPYPERPVAFAANVTTHKAVDSKRLSFPLCTTGVGYGWDWFEDLGINVQPGEDGAIPVTQSLSDAGYIKDGFLELSFLVIMPLS